MAENHVLFPRNVDTSSSFEELKTNRVLLDLRKHMSVQVEYEFLESRPRSNYKQLWVKGRHMRAEVLYRYTAGPEPESPEHAPADNKPQE